MDTVTNHFFNKNHRLGIDLYQQLDLHTEVGYVARNLVEDPFSLKIYLDRVDSLIGDDFQAMVCRCIEKSRDQSLTYLLSYRKPLLDWRTRLPMSGVELKLLIKRYPINDELYNRARQRGYSDPYFDGIKLGNYPQDSLIEKESMGYYSGYRDAYHLLLYSLDRSSLIQRLQRQDLDCTFTATCDFLGYPRWFDPPLEDVIQQIR